MWEFEVVECYFDSIKVPLVYFLIISNAFLNDQIWVNTHIHLEGKSGNYYSLR